MTTQTKTTLPAKALAPAGALAKGWRKVKLGELFKVKHGYAFKGEYFSDKGKYILLTPGNFSEKSGLVLKGSKEKYYTGDIPKDYILKKESLLVAMTDILQTAPYLGAPAVIDKDDTYLHNQRLGLVYKLDNKKVDKNFLYWVFQSGSVRHQIRGSASGSTVKHTSPERIYACVTVIPDTIEEQKRIADILSAFDDKIELNNKIGKNLEQTAQAIFKEWFIGNAKIKNQNAKLWKVKNVMEIVKRIPVGKKYDNKTALPAGKVPILDQGQSGYIGYHNDEPGVAASIDEPVVIFTNHTCNYRLMTRPFSAIQNVLPYIGINGYPTLFVYYLTRGKIAMQEYKGHWPEFEQQEFLVPPPDSAVEFAFYLEPMVQKIVETENENQKLAALRDLLLPKLMSGQIQV